MLANNFNVGDKFTYGDYGLITVIEIQEEIRCINKNIKIEQDGKQFIVNIKDIDFKYWGC